MNCGLLGKTLGHSYSAQIHSYLGDYSYKLFEKQPEELESFIRTGDFTGLNVTIPYKKDVIPFCDILTDCAKKLGAVNTIIRRKDGTLIGHNTDYFGFRSMVDHSGIDVCGRKTLVLGSGGASVTAVAVLQELGANVIVISRSGVNNYSNLELHSDASVIVNATPVGMYPHAGTSPVDLDQFPNLTGVLDIVYNPTRTQLLIDAAKRGIPAENGLWMLIAQAKEGAEWFTGQTISDSVIQVIHKKMCKQMENLILIGMPGCGKSTIGKILALKLGKQFVDADAAIEQRAGMSIPEIFAKYGEEEFRKLETSVLEELGQKSCLVIATGGGCVTKQVNYPLLHQNGTIFWIQRPISQLATGGRPLSKAGKLEEMFQSRKPLYESFADYTVFNDSAPENTVTQILNIRGVL